MRAKPLRVILDTNVWISFLISRKLSKLDTPIRNVQIKLYFSRESVSEFLKVASRPKLRKYFTPEELEQVIGYMDSYGQMIEVTAEVHVCRDPDDDFWLELAADASAHYLVTGDEDLLVIKKYGDTEIITVAEFLRRI